MLQKTKTFYKNCVQYFQLCVGKAVFSSNMTAFVYKANSIKTWFEESGVEELKWPQLNPDLSTTEDL